jgi:hypothetical protein
MYSICQKRVSHFLIGKIVGHLIFGILRCGLVIGTANILLRMERGPSDLIFTPRNSEIRRNLISVVRFTMDA